MRIRHATASDLRFLEEMAFEAFYWNPNAPRRPLAAFRKGPDCAKLLGGWGRPGDRAIVAQSEDDRLGAAWFRLWTTESHSYGFVDAATPELGLAVAPDHRSRGIGRLLLHALIAIATEERFTAVSLSVDPANRAIALYESAGFRKVGESGASWTLLLPLGPM